MYMDIFSYDIQSLVINIIICIYYYIHYIYYIGTIVYYYYHYKNLCLVKTKIQLIIYYYVRISTKKLSNTNILNKPRALMKKRMFGTKLLRFLYYLI